MEMYLIVIRYTLHLLIDSTIFVDVEKYILSIFILFFWYYDIGAIGFKLELFFFALFLVECKKTVFFF